MVGTKPTARARCGASISRTHSVSRSGGSRDRRARKAREITRRASCYAFSNSILHLTTGFPAMLWKSWHCGTRVGDASRNFEKQLPSPQRGIREH